jgi:hypothetical protein
MAGIKDAYFGDTPAALPPYPQSPGFRVPGPSQQAAERFAAPAKSIRARVLKAVTEAGPHGITADELMVKLGLAEIVVRPRLSELRRDGAIRDSGRRRTGNSGMLMSVWTVAADLPNQSKESA